MKVVFWSNYPDSGVTSNMTALGVAMSFMFRGKTIMMSNHYNHANLGRALLGVEYDGMVREECNYFANGSTKHYFKQMISHANRRQIADGTIEVVDDGLYYFLQSKLFSNEVYELRIWDEIAKAMDELESVADFLFVDAKSQESRSSLRLLESADIVVVNLKQEENAIRNFFKRYSALAGKCLFLISAYRRDFPYKKRKFVREFKIHPDRVAVLPYNPEFQTEFSDGRIVNYIGEHFNCKKSSAQYRYIWHLKQAATLLMDAITERIMIDGVRGEICEDN